MPKVYQRLVQIIPAMKRYHQANDYAALNYYVDEFNELVYKCFPFCYGLKQVTVGYINSNDNGLILIAEHWEGRFYVDITPSFSKDFELNVSGNSEVIEDRLNDVMHKFLYTEIVGKEI